MPYQTGQNVSVRYKKQAGLGTPASGGSGYELPLIASGGLVPQKAAIESPEVRSDGMTTVARHGSRSVSGSYSAVGRAGGTDLLLEALCRSTWVASFTVTDATMTSITTTTNTIVAAGGSWITQGVRVGDVVRLTGHSTSANNSKNLIVTGVTTDTITVPAGSLTLDAAPDSAFTLTVLKRLGMGVTESYWTFDEYHADIDQSETFTDCKITSLSLAMQADDTVRLDLGVMGRDFQVNASGASPVLTSPTAFQSANLVATDAVILKDGVAVADLTGFTLSIDTGGQMLPVIGSTTSPDVFLNNTRVSGSFSLPRTDLAYLTLFDAETEFSLFFLLREPGSEPRACLGVFVPVVKLMTAPDASLGGAGAMVSTVNFVAGKKPTTTGYVETMVQFSSSAA